MLMPADHTAALRVLDAAANRASEALRVVEDHARFVLDDAHLTEQWKRLRHDLTAALGALPAELRAACRDTTRDVGTSITTPAEQQRENLADILAANLSRTQQALRTLEEFSKFPMLAAGADGGTIPTALESLRYRCYTLAAAMETTRHGQVRLAGVHLMALVDAGPDPASFERLVEDLFRAGVPAIQLRDKQLDDRALLQRAARLAALARQHQRIAIINDRADIAAAARADGVHLGQEDLPVAVARRIVGPDILIGVSTHSLSQAQQAELEGASYIGVGPTFPSGTKTFDHFPGLALLREVAAEISLPTFAIGGITLERVPEIMECGIERVAVGQAISAADNPASAATELVALICHHNKS
jgi:thiamine-phosphate pyrophosphorylase